MFGRLVQVKEAFPNSHCLFSGLLATGVLHDYVPSDWDIRRLPQSWSPSSWRAWPVHQIPVYPDPAKFLEVERRLGGRPQLVSPAKVRRLKEYLAEAEEGRAFVLQGGDCAERFSDCGTDAARDTFRLLQRMAGVLADAAAVPVVKIGRMAGQFAKPRSTDREVRGDVILPCYRGDIINDRDFTPAARTPDPARMEMGYAASASTLESLRSMVDFDDLELRRAQLRQHGAPKRPRPQGRADAAPHGRDVDFYTSHEALLLPYEECLTRRDPTTGEWYDGSAHFLWVGDRTRQADGAHIEFLRGIRNPVGVKVGPTQDQDELRTILDVLNPANEGGRIMLISRMGADKIGTRLPGLIRAVESSGHNVAWLCDPMHGNTFATATGIKTRDFAMIVQEMRDFFSIHDAENTWAGGLHLEMTGRDVTECVGGADGPTKANLHERYETACDPRLNHAQAMELGNLAAEGLNRRRLAV